MQRRNFIRQTLATGAGLLLFPDFLYADDKSNKLSKIINVKTKGEPLQHFWSKCVGAGRANEGLRASWLEQLKLAKEYCGFQYCRFHGLFHDDMFAYHEENGKSVYNWQYIDELFDRMLEIGVRPFVELGFMPKDLSSDDSLLQFWWKAHVAPPKDYIKWATLIGELVKHCISRYGLNEVKTWYFEVWNEPDLHGFWLGTKSQYFELYKVSVNAIKAIDPSLRVGGPATSNFVPDERFDGEVEDKTKHKTLTVADINTLKWHGVWIKDFLNYCQKEKLPIDFIATHPYPTDWALDPETKKGAGKVRHVIATAEDLAWLQKTIKASAYPNAELHCTEWSSSPSSRDPQHDGLPAATYVIKANIDSIGLTNSLSYWTFTDVFEEKGAGDTCWHGGFGMINFQGIVKPAFHAYRMLHQLGNEILRNEEGLVVTRHSATGKITALVYHYPSEMVDVVAGATDALMHIGNPRNFSLNLGGLNPGLSFTIESLDSTHGHAYGAWKKMGSPEPPSREQTKQLKDAAWATNKTIIKVAANGTLAWQKTLQPWECVLINA